jgi:AraC-like DNA-binding protein
VIAQRALRPAPGIAEVVRGYRERTGSSQGPGVVVPLPGRPAQFLEIYLDTPYQVSTDGGSFEAAPDAVVVGASSRHSARLWVQGSIATFHIAFQPTGFHRLFGLGMDQIADRGAPADDLGLKPLDDLVDQVRRGRDFESRARIADDWVAHRLAWARPQAPVDRIARLIRRAGGAPSVSELAARAGLSTRQLQRRFVEQVGLAPKLYARTVRFEAVLASRERQPGLTWAALAQKHGYFDQAHLLRDAHAFTGAPPTALIGQEAMMSDPS